MPLKSRVRRLESRGREHIAIRRVHYRQALRVYTLIAQARVYWTPGLDAVLECDTDPQTWQSIQRTRALARGEEPPEEPADPVVRYSTPEALQDAFRDGRRRAGERTRRVNEAVEAAKRRLALS